MTLITNKQRAGWATAAIEGYNEAKEGKTIPYDTLEIVFTDLLCDLMHYAERSNLEFDICVNRAESHFQDEQMERNIDMAHQMPLFLSAMKKARDELLFLQNTGARGTNDTETREALHSLNQAIAKAEGDAS